MASAKGYFLYENTFDVVLAIIEADILYNDGIMSTNVFFEAVEKSNAPCVINVCLLKGKQVGHIQVVGWTHSTQLRKPQKNILNALSLKIFHKKVQ